VTAAWLGVADEIGEDLVQQAIWHEDMCNWMGALPEPGPGDGVQMTYAALTPDLYGGTSGVALFLAELYSHTGDPRQRQTALGAARQAATHSGAIAAGQPGLYAGLVGLVFALWRIGDCLGEPDVVREARALTRQLESSEHADGFDLMSGAAGAVVGLLALEPLLGADRSRTLAERFGARLLSMATRDGDKLSWPLNAAPDAPHLLGLSHGAAGAATAFLELHAVTGAPRWREAAQRAMAYERSRYEPRALNWPDLRGSGSQGDWRPSFPVFWCHGAPGIALSRLRAVELIVDEEARQEAVIALDTTRAAVENGVAASGNFSLCHGLAGNAEVLLLGRRVLGESRTADEQTALGAAVYGRDNYAGRRDWPCGTYEGETPSLFLGLAGIGRFYLRLHQPSLPSLLLPTLAGDSAELQPR
jgi:lantibiotic modifying enzyme